MTTVNRALSGPINIHCDHSDSMGGRDAGWIQIYNEDAQEAYDATIMGFPIAEHADVRLPLMNMYDGFIISGAIGPLRPLSDGEVQSFVGEAPAAAALLRPEPPRDHGPVRRSARLVLRAQGQPEPGHGSGAAGDPGDLRPVRRAHRPPVQPPHDLRHGRRRRRPGGHRLGGGQRPLGRRPSCAHEGLKVGIIKLRTFRPFPTAEVRAGARRNVKAVGIMDRADSFGAQGGPLYLEILAALYQRGVQTKTVNFIYGLGGREIYPQNIEDAYPHAAGRRRRRRPAARPHLPEPEGSLAMATKLSPKQYVRARRTPLGRPPALRRLRRRRDRPQRPHGRQGPPGRGLDAPPVASRSPPPSIRTRRGRTRSSTARSRTPRPPSAASSAAYKSLKRQGK